MKKILYLFLALASYGIFAQTTAEEYLNSAVSKFYLSDMKGAITDYTKAIKIDSNYVEAYRKRGLAKEELKDFSGAIVDYTKAIEITERSSFTDSNAMYYYNRGLSKYYLGDKIAACKDARKAQDLRYDASALIAAACN